MLITNDDGPPDTSISPYIANFVNALQRMTDWEIVIAVPSQQRSWISKAHIIGEDVQGTVQKFEETGELEWLLLDGTPASCANIGVKYLKAPIDLVISGPNYGRNTSAAYIMSSGTVGAATEAAICGVKSIALSYSYTQFNHPIHHINQGSELSVALIKHLVANWHEATQVYTINVPLFEGLSMKTPIKYTKILENQWSDCFKQSETTKNLYLWSPNYEKCDETVYAAGTGSDAWVVMHNEVTVSPIRAVFQHIDVGEQEIKL